MKAVLLVGGKGTRLRPLTYGTPKPMLPIVGVPMIEWVARYLARHGIDEIVLSMGYLPERFTDAYPLGEVAGLATTYVVEPEPLDTAGAIRHAAREAKIDETFVVLNGDVISDMDLGALIDFHQHQRGLATLATHPVQDPSAFGVVVSESDGLVRAFVEKPPIGSVPSNMINAGAYVLEPEVLDYIEPHQPVSIERAVFPRLAKEGRLFARSDQSYWLDTGTLANFLQANLDVLSGRRPSPFEHTIHHFSWCSPSSVVDPRANIVSSVVDNLCRVEQSATVENSVVMPGAVIGAGAVVQGSVIGPNAVVEAGRMVVNSIVGADQHGMNQGPTQFTTPVSNVRKTTDHVSAAASITG